MMAGSERTALVDAAFGPTMDHAAAVRRLRHVRELAAAISEVEAEPDAEALAAVARRARATEALEGLIAGVEAGACLSMTLNRFATLTQLSVPVARCMMTSIGRLPAPAGLASGLMAALNEFVFFVGEIVPAERPVRLFIASEVEEGELVLAFAAAGAEDRPVPTGAAAAALRQAERIVELLGGGVNRGVKDGMLLIGVIVPVGRGSRSRGVRPA